MATSGSDKPRVALPSINQALLTTCVVGALTNLRGPVAAMIDGAPPPQSVFINGLVLAYAAANLYKSQAKVGYATLDGRERDSFAREAGELALAGEVPRRVGGYKVATFAGGCFWGTELHFQRIPGVAATCVGYTQGWAGEPNYDQYRHGIYPHSKEQAEAAAAVVEATQAKYAEPVVTEVKDAAVFWPAATTTSRTREGRPGRVQGRDGGGPLSPAKRAVTARRPRGRRARPPPRRASGSAREPGEPRRDLDGPRRLVPVEHVPDFAMKPSAQPVSSK
ncbi:peptide-methionine (S)-S-oxide reductase [Aureococcus anophagefferens]|nr:peptide-methionine (S)-S-oxide reductase [Aureococcus anophagefferens]